MGLSSWCCKESDTTESVHTHFRSGTAGSNLLLHTCVLAQSLQLCPTLCDPPGLKHMGSSVLNCILEFTQVHVHRVSDAT